MLMEKATAYIPSEQACPTTTDWSGKPESCYGSEGRGFESLRACPGQRLVSLGGADLVRCQLVLTFESPDTPEACRASCRSAIMTIWAMQRLPYGRRTLSSADCWKSISGLA